MDFCKPIFHISNFFASFFYKKEENKIMSVIKNLKKNYHSFHIHIPEWQLSDKGITALIGVSGAGKTSILRILSGLDPCPSLQWIFNGVDLAKLPVPKRKIGFVFQSLELFPHLSAYENIKFGGFSHSSIHSSKTSSDKDHLHFLIDSFHLSKIKHQKADQLSGGEAQRVALARAFMSQPRILFLDEPFSSLDEENKNRATEMVQKTVRHYNIPAILVSHDKQDVKKLADDIVEIENGQLKKNTILRRG